MDIGLLILRVVVGMIFFMHGAQKLFGWFGGYGLQGTGGWLESLGYRRGTRKAAMAGLAEAGGGLLLAFGFLTPLAAAALIGVMVNAILAVHRPHGLLAQGGYEYPLVLIAVATALAFIGPGSVSLDAAIGWDIFGVVWGLAALTLGLIAGVVMHSTRRLAEQAEVERRVA